MAIAIAVTWRNCSVCADHHFSLRSVPSAGCIVEEPAFDDCPALRAVMSGGEALPTQVIARFQRRSGAKLYNVYGPTETIINSTCWLCEETDGLASSPIGRPIPNARIYILDSALRPLPIGVAGHMHIGGVGLARGYLNRPDLTAEKFIPDPFSAEPGARLYKPVIWPAICPTGTSSSSAVPTTECDAGSASR